MSNNIINHKSNDVFWLYDPTILFRNNNYYKIIPNANMTTNQIFNSLTLFFIFLAILCLLFCRQLIYVPIIAIIIIIFWYFIQKNYSLQKTQINSKETLNTNNSNNNDNKFQVNNRSPTKNNPFMNITMADLIDNTKPQCDNIANDDNEINDADDNFDNCNDNIFGICRSQRQFYTMPVTTIPNDQTAFAKWVYGAPETCKENTMNCLRYEDIRHSRNNPVIDKSEENNIQNDMQFDDGSY